MNKQELINKLKKLLTTPSEIEGYDFDDGYDFGIESSIALAKELDDPVIPLELEKPKVPQFLANWYEEHKNYFEYNLYSLCVEFHKRKLPDDLHEWFNCLSNKPIETLVKMKLYGYEVEKEKLYTVEFPNPNSGGHVVLCKTSDGIVSISFAGMARWKGGKNFQLTETEIKQDFYWAWQFAEEVEK